LLAENIGIEPICEVTYNITILLIFLFKRTIYF